MEKLVEGLMYGSAQMSFGLGVLLLSLRVAPVLAMTPLFSMVPMPTRIRVCLVLGFSAVLATGWGQGMPAVPDGDVMPMLRMALFELALGSVLAFGVLVAFAAFSVAGRLLDVQIGFGMAQVYDPASRRQLPLLTSAFNYLAVLVFFLIDGPHALLRGLALSLERFPLGAPWPLDAAAGMILTQTGALLVLGFALAAPVAVSMLLVELALGVVARNLPQMNIFTVGFPVKIVVGLVALSAWIAGAGGTMSRAYASIFDGWGRFFEAGALAPARGG